MEGRQDVPRANVLVIGIKFKERQTHSHPHKRIMQRSIGRFQISSKGAWSEDARDFPLSNHDR